MLNDELTGAARLQALSPETTRLTPEQATEAIQRARARSIPPSAATAARDFLKEEDNADATVDAINRAAAVGKWYRKSPEHAAAIKDDLEDLTASSETLASRIGRYAKAPIDAFARGFDAVVTYDPSLQATKDYWSRAARDITAEGAARSLAAGTLDLGVSALGLGSMYLENFTAGGFAERMARREAGMPDGTAAGDLLNEGAQLASDWITAKVAPEAETAEGRGVYSAARSAPTTFLSLVPGVRAARAARSATLLGTTSRGALAGSSVAGAVTGGQSYVRGRAEGLDPAAAAAFAGTDAVIETGTEMLPISRFLGGLSAGDPFLKRLLNITVAESVGEQFATLGQDFNSWASIDSNKGKTFGDFLAERPGAAYETLIASVVMSGAMTTGQTALEKAANRFGRTYEGTFLSEADAKTLELVQQHAEASKLLQRDPASFEEFIRDAAEGTEATDVYIDAQQLAQVFNQSGVDPVEAAALTGIAAEDMVAAVERGEDVRIPVEVFAARIATSDVGSKLIGHLRIDPEGMSREEAKAFMQSAEQEFSQIAEQELGKTEVENATVASRDAVRDQMLEQLNAVNRFTPGTNFAYATLHAHAMANIGAQAGLTAEQMAERYALGVQAEGLADATFDQPAPRGPTINIGMSTKEVRGPDAPDLTPDEIQAALESLGARVVQSSQVQSDTEPTTVLELAEALTPEQMEALSSALWQQAIPQLVGDQGELYGPQAEGWRPFNPEYFRLLSGDTLASTFQQEARLPTLEGLPEASPGSFPPALEAAAAYMDASGLPYNPPRKYVKINRARAERIAAAYEAMKHDPDDADVKAAYKALADETLAQWQFVKATGLVVEFEPSESSAYSSPWDAVHDVRDNNHLYVFNTDDGYGQDGITAQDERENPMLAFVPGEEWSGRPVRVNDVFRAVHDYFGHIKDGVGFRAAGEENAWRAHAAMFSPLARRALTTETRGQNSWLNYGPYGETNRTAKVEDTVFAEQKIGLMPQWVVDDGRTDEPTPAQLAAQTEADLRALAETLGQVEPDRLDRIYRDTLTKDVRVSNSGKVIVLTDSVYKLDPLERVKEAQQRDNWTYALQDSAEWINARPLYLTAPPTNSDGTVSLQHYGPEGIEITDPSRWGQGIIPLPQSERQRVGSAPPRTYFGIATGVPGGYRSEFGKGLRPQEGVALYEARVPLASLYDMDANPDRMGEGTGLTAEQYEHAIRDAGYAGYWTQNDQLGLVAVLFEPTAVVRVPTDNLGQTFNQSPVFYSALGRAIGNSKTNRAPAQQWIATLKKTPGVTADELEWSGIEDFLNMQDGPVTREQLLELVQNGGIQIEETVLGSLDDETEIARRIEAEMADIAEIHGEFDEEGRELYERQNWERIRREVVAGTQTKFASWSSDPNNETYRELLLRLPAGQGTNPERSPGTHWDDEAVVAHARFREATDTDGNKILFIEEVQSDWHQKGRDQGYAEPADPAEVERARVALGEASDNELSARGDWEQEFTALLQTFDPDERMRIEWSPRNPDRAMRAMREVRVERLEGEPDAIRAQYAGVNAAYSTWQQANLRRTEANTAYINAINSGQGIPDAPFRTSWPALVMKRMIRWAVDNGYQKIAWTTGAQQAERYNLSQSIGDLSATLQDDGSYAVQLGSGRAARTLIENNLAEDYREFGDNALLMTEAQLAEAFGKDVAQRIVDGAAEGFDARGERQEYLTAAEDARDAARDAIEQYEQALRDQAIDALVNDVTPGLEGLTPERLRETAVTATRGSSNEALIRTLGWDEEQAAAWQAGLDALWNDLTNARREVANAESQIGADVTLQGEDLTVGGEGMKAFYDRNLVNITNKLIKKSGARVGPVAVQGVEGPNARQRSGIEAEIQRTAGLTAYGLRTVADAEARAAELEAQGPRLQGDADRLRAAIPLIAELEALPQGETQPGFEITPELAAQARGGFAMFQRNGQPRGQIHFTPDLQASTITLLRGADLSTFLHESGHFYWQVMVDLVQQPGASDSLKADVRTMLDFIGVPTLADWQRMDLASQTSGHEKIARAFEAYLFEGRAPSVELQGMFTRFARWLRAVYRSLAGLDVELTDEVRGVFDRMLASEQEIAEVEAQQGLEPFFTERPEGIPVSEWEAYQREGLEATETAIQELASRSMRDMQYAGRAVARELKKLQREAADNRRAVKEEVTEELNAQPLYRTIKLLRTGKLDGQPVEGPYKLSTVEVRALLQLEDGEPLPAALNGMTSSKNGVHPQQIAELAGYDSADRLLHDLLFATPISEAIEAETDNRMRERFGELSSPEDLEEAAQSAVHNAVRGRFVAGELAALNASQGKGTNRRALLAAARKLAGDTINRLPLRNVRPGQYEAGERREARKAVETRGDLAKAATHKRNQLLQHELARAAHEARDKAERVRKYLRKFDKTSVREKLDPDFRDQIDQLLEAVQLRAISDAEADRRTAIREWIEQMSEEGFEPVLDAEFLNQINRKAFRDLTIEEIETLNDSVRNIEFLARRTKELLTAKDKAELDAAALEVAQSITDNARTVVELPIGTPTTTERARGRLREFFGSLRKLGNIAFVFDGNRYGGAAWERLVRPLNEAADREATMNREATARLRELFQSLPGEDNHTRRYEPAIDASISNETRLMIALNMGNSANVQRLMDGDGWSYEQLQAVVAPLTNAHWDWVERVWGLIGSYYPEISAKHERVNGVPMQRVEAEPFQVEVEGETRLLPGGYFPIKYDPDRSDRADAQQAADPAKEMMRGAYTRATTRRGHTKERVDSVIGRPLRKDFGVVFEHIASVIHDLTHHEALIDVTRMLRHPSVSSAIRMHYGPELIRTLRDMQTDVAGGQIAQLDTASRVLSYLRKGTTIGAMGWNFFEAIQNTTGMFQSMARVGTGPVLGALWSWVGNPTQANAKLAWIRENSAFMDNRLTTFNRELNELRNRVGPRGPVRRAIAKASPRLADQGVDALVGSFFYMTGKTQLLTDIPVWIAKYEQSIAAGEEHTRAVAIADQAVIDSQSSGMIKDLARMQSTTVGQLFTSFYGFFSTTYNLNVDRINEFGRKGRSDMPSFFVDMALINFFPAIISTLLFTAFRGSDDDWEELGSTLAQGQLSFILAQIPVLREATGTLTGRPSYSGPPAFAGFAAANQLGAQVLQGELDEASLRAFNRTMGVLFHYPASQVDKTTRGITALANGEAGPQAVLFGPPIE